MSLSNPLLLKKVLVRHPKLRLYVVHAGWPMGRPDDRTSLRTPAGLRRRGRDRLVHSEVAETRYPVQQRGAILGVDGERPDPAVPGFRDPLFVLEIPTRSAFR